MFGIGKLFAGGITEAVGGIANVVDQFVETDDEKRIAKQITDRMLMEPKLAQIELNKIEAAHRSIFVAGWRPFIGWVCGVALLWHFMAYDLLNWAAMLFNPEFAPPKLGGTEKLIAVVMSLLGLGGLRTFEKFKGKTS
jgi:hypothetical protein